MAVALAQRADLIVTDDAGLRAVASDCGLKSMALSELPLAGADLQRPLPLDDAG